MIEDVLKQARAAVQNNLAAALAVEQLAYRDDDIAEFGFEVDLKDMRAIRFEEEEEMPAQNLPCLFILPRGLRSDPYMSAHVGNKHLIDFIVVIQDQNPAVLARRLFRTVEALRRTLTEKIEKASAATDLGFGVRIQNIDYSPVTTGLPGGPVKASTLTVRIDEVDDRP